MEELSLGLVRVNSNSTSAGVCEVKVCKVFGEYVFKCYWEKEGYLLNFSYNAGGNNICDFQTSHGKMYINADSAAMLHNIRQQLKTIEQANNL